MMVMMMVMILVMMMMMMIIMILTYEWAMYLAADQSDRNYNLIFRRKW